MEQPVSNRVIMLPVAANFKKHFHEASREFRARDVCALALLAPHDRAIEIEKLAQGMAAGLGPKLGAEIFTLSHKLFSQALDTAVNRFLSTNNTCHTRKKWEEDVAVIIKAATDLAMTKPDSSGWRQRPVYS